MLRDAVVRSGEVALSHVVIARREREVAIMPMGRRLVVHTLHEERDLNNAGEVFDRIPKAETDPEMVKLATQLIDGQTGTYDPAPCIESPRIKVTLATGIPEARCRQINLGYKDYRQIDPQAWAHREAEGLLLVPHAGEMLFRLQDESSISAPPPLLRR